jgi:TolB-like protein
LGIAAGLLGIGLAAGVMFVLTRGGPANVAPLNGPAVTGRTTLSVTPLKNRSGDAAQDALAGEVTEALIGDLTRSAAFDVAPYPPDGPSPTVLVLEGSVRQTGDRLLVTLQLVEGATDAHVWVKGFEGRADDLYGIIQDAARAIEEQAGRFQRRN